MRLAFSAVFLGIAAVVGLAGFASAGGQDPVAGKVDEKAKAAPDPAPASADKAKADASAREKAPEKPKLEVATFGGGCFWCLEAFFERIKGVKSVVSGFAGGQTPRPTYEMVCTGLTGHAEVVQIEFDPSVVTYDDLLSIFWLCHDPTTPNRQGVDVGTQYRSIILFHDEAQKKAALKSYEKATADHMYPNPIVTELVPFTKFYAADRHHQDYYRKNPSADYCQMVITPKLQALRAKLNAKATANGH